MKVLYLTREFPPHVYGGAGVHIEHLAAEMARLTPVEVKCYGDQDQDDPRLRVAGYPPDEGFFAGNEDPAVGALQTLLTGLRFNARPPEADLVHCHTWYSHWGGIVAKLAYGLPLVVTVHSLEPLRPWKREQLGRGYDLSSWVERTALEMADRVVAVSQRERERILELFDLDAERVVTVPNGIDPQVYRKVDGGPARKRYGIADGPFVLFVGRMSRQKGIVHFLEAARRLPEEVGVVLVAASPDSPEVEVEVQVACEKLKRERKNFVHVQEMIPRGDAVQLYSEASVFVCPSVYEPFGIINLEAMACETPVVASAVGGILEVVVHGETGLLVDPAPSEPETGEPKVPEAFRQELADRIIELLEDEGRAARMGWAGRRRVEESFGWPAVAARLHEIYREVLEERK